MNDTLTNLLTTINFGEKAVFENMTVFPILKTQNSSVEYLTLKRSLEQNQLIIEEVSQGGNVPELRAKNLSEKPILLLDGEEIIGAKQNRILNTSVLLPGNSKTIINVSCTEAGRWSYDTPQFSDSDEVMASTIRANKMSSVHFSLRSGGGYRSDQGEVWDNISERQSRANIHSATGAMKDVYEAKKHKLNEYLEQFPLVDSQAGLLVFIDGKPAGMDVVSSGKAYKLYHEKMVRSYAMEATLSRRPSNKAINDIQVKDFIYKAKICHEEKHKSVGLGNDYRYEGSGMVGSALIYENTVIHTAFFSLGDENKEKMSGFRMRRRYRM